MCAVPLASIVRVSARGADVHVAQELVDAGVPPTAATELSQVNTLTLAAAALAAVSLTRDPPPPPPSPTPQLLCEAACAAAAAMAKRTSQAPSKADTTVRVTRMKHVARPHRLLEHGSTALRVNEEHYAKLVGLYRRGVGGDAADSGMGDSDDGMHADMFSMVARYETLSACSSGYQGALPDSTFEALQSLFMVAHECFASPLNCCLGSYCRCYL